MKALIGQLGAVSFEFLIYKIRAVRKFFWRCCYNYLSKDPKKTGHWTFMNYGYSDPQSSSNPQPAYVQAFADQEFGPVFADMARLYYEVCTCIKDISFADKDVLEVGSGRGGGAALIAQELKPKSYLGVDFANNSIRFCQTQHDSIANLSFKQGDAENLPFDDASFDVAVNIESSHCYGNFPKFISEVHRVLRPKGIFYFADFRPSEAAGELEKTLKESGFSVLQHRDITENVLASLKQTSDLKKQFIAEQTPKGFSRPSNTFAGIEGTLMFERFASRKELYHLFVLRKG